MNSENLHEFFVGIVIGIFVGVLICKIVTDRQDKNWRKILINANLAEYSSKTGEFMLKTNSFKMHEKQQNP